ncbi:MAG: VWA domain-containing protein [Thermodesulfobacteria bacterium]|nr:VWA domain-containing protein [Thermodesulfobacteriota bacterium]
MARPRQKGSFSVFSLSFLDIMFCGFGAVVLLVLIINSQMVRHRNEEHKELSSKVRRLEQEVNASKELLSRKLNSLEKVRTQAKRLEGRAKIVLNEIKKTRVELARYLGVSTATLEDVRRLESELKSLDSQHKRMLARLKKEQESGQQALRIPGQGRRQYITGLRLGGRRILLLVDSSASMLASSIVSIVRLKNMPAARRVRARKWQRVIRTARWLLANLPLSSRVKVALFNDRVRFLGPSKEAWVSVQDTASMNQISKALSGQVPDKGTSLYRAFLAAAQLSPLPDNIILLTDGLPTIGAKAPSRGKVMPDERVELFKRATARLPRGITVNTILFPLEGDPKAPSLFWQLAVATRGSFFTPSKDWP